MKTKTLFLGAAICCACAAAEGSRETHLTGSWVLQGDPKVTLNVDESDGKIHVTEKKGDEVTLEYACNTDGKDCNAKDEGHSAKISIWFNGPKLVELETRGSHVTRRRFVAAEDGKSLSVEVSPIAPQGKSETLEFARQ